MPNKKILIIRGGQPRPKDLAEDTFDSTMEIFDETGKSIYKIPFANTDFCKGYKGGILAEGNYSGIFAKRRDTGNKVVFFYNSNSKIQVKTVDNLTDAMRTFPSLIPNPNHNNDKVITNVLIHCDDYTGGWSHGCQTVYPEYWPGFIALFAINELVDIELKRADGWTAPDYYQGA